MGPRREESVVDRLHFGGAAQAEVGAGPCRGPTPVHRLHYSARRSLSPRLGGLHQAGIPVPSRTLRIVAATVDAERAAAPAAGPKNSSIMPTIEHGHAGLDAPMSAFRRMAKEQPRRALVADQMPRPGPGDRSSACSVRRRASSWRSRAYSLGRRRCLLSSDSKDDLYGRYGHVATTMPDSPTSEPQQALVPRGSGAASRHTASLEARIAEAIGPPARVFPVFSLIFPVIRKFRPETGSPVTASAVICRRLLHRTRQPCNVLFLFLS